MLEDPAQQGNARHASQRRPPWDTAPEGRTWTAGADLTTQQNALAALGVDPKRIYLYHGLTGTNRNRPGLRQAMAACRQGDTLVVTKLDRLARSVPDARDIVDELTASGVRLNIGGSIHDPTDPIGRLLFTTLSMIAEFEADLARTRTWEGMAVARSKGRLRGKQPKLSPSQEAHLVELYRAGGRTISELEELFSVTRSTIYRAVGRAGGRAGVTEPFTDEAPPLRLVTAPLPAPLLVHDDATGRWNVAYDAADPLPMPDNITKLPFLDQSHPIAHAAVAPVRAAGGPIALVYALDSDSNHPSYIAALLQVSGGAVTALYVDRSQGLQQPVVTGTAGDQRVLMTADLIAPDLGACCRVRTYTFGLTVGAGGVATEVSDDRPLLGIWVMPVTDSVSSDGNQPLRVLSIDPGSPSAGKLSPGDVIEGFSGPRIVPAGASTGSE